MYKKTGLLLAITLIVLFNCQIGDAFSLPKPLAKLTIIVVDEETNEPIKDAEVGVTFNQSGFFEPQYSRVEGTTDEDGKFSASKTCTGSVDFSAIAQGYYKTGFDYRFEKITSKFQVRHKPWNPKITLKLRKIKSPVPMYARKIYYAVIPELDKAIGFDLMAGDWVSPYGKGKVSDFIFTVIKEYKKDQDYQVDVSLTFSGSFDGIYPFPVMGNYPSKLKLPSLAPVGGYQKKLEKYHATDKSNNYNKNQHYYFRIRSQEKNGELEKALYGKIYHDIKVDAFGYYEDKSGRPAITFEYYLNPDGTRNVEFDPKQNLFKDLKPSEQVQYP